MGAPVYRLEDVAYAYPGGTSSFRLELGSLAVGEGEILALVGPNGAGKTTQLTLLAFLARPVRGRLEYRGADPWAGGDGAVAARREAVLVTHHPYLFKGTVADNVLFGLKLRKLPEEAKSARLRSALAFVELDGSERTPASRLSAGQAQRVALARALALEPRTLLLDEPTAGVDAAIGLRLEAVLREVSRAAGVTVVFSTHDFSQASRLADSIVHLSEGRRVEFSHENCFSGTARSDGRSSWIEPRPGVRLYFAGPARGHVTCVIDPEDIRLTVADGEAAEMGRNVFAGRVTRMETTDAATARVRVGGDLVFRVALPVAEVEAKGVSLSRGVLLRFEPEAVAIIGPRTAGNPR